MNRVKSEESHRNYTHPSVLRQPPAENIQETAGPQVQNDDKDVPPQRVQAEQRMVRSQPKHEDRAVIECETAGLNPDMRREITQRKVPGFDAGIVYDLRKVVVDEIKKNSLEINGGGY